jgi:adenylate cyclase
LIVGVVIGAAGTLFALTPAGLDFEEKVGLAWLFRVRGPIQPPPDVVVVALDRRSAEYLQLPRNPREWPRGWPRSLHGKLVDELKRRGASTIVFDMRFETEQRSDEDASFADAIGRAGRVLLFQGGYDDEQPRRQPVPDGGGDLVLHTLRQPLPAFANAASGLAPFPLPGTPARVSRALAFQSDQAPTLPALALQMYGSEVFETWRSVLEDSERSIGATYLPNWSGVNNGPSVSDLSRAVRVAFKRDPEFGRRVRQASEDVEKKDNLRGTGQAGALLNAWIRLYEGPDSFYLNFYGPAGAIPTIPYYALVSPDSSGIFEHAFDLTGKAVFIGFSELVEPTKSDRVETVFSRSDGVNLSGVEIAATAFANLLTGRDLKPADRAMAGGILLGLGAIIAPSAYALPPVMAVSLVLAVAAGYAVAAQVLFDANDIWLPIATPILLQLPLALFLGLLARSLLERRQRKHIQHAIRYFVPGEVARELADHPVEPLKMGETVYATCLATDAEAFTALAEGMMPEAAAAYLNQYFAALAEPIDRYGCNVKEFRADGSMCAWTSSQPDAAVRSRACFAALEALAAIQRFSEHNAPLRLGVRLGLHAGRVFVGPAGGGGRFAFAIIGDIANTASRIEALNKQLGTRLLASAEVVAGLDDVLARPLGEFRLAGKHGVVSVFEIMGLAESASMAQLSLCGRFPAALQRVREQRWGEAAASFEAILRDHPTDGPSRFYLDRCSKEMEAAAQ